MNVTVWGFVLALVLLFLNKEYTDLMRPVARRVVQLAAWVQRSSRTRYRAEWFAELMHIQQSSDRSGLPFAIGVTVSAASMRATAFQNSFMSLVREARRTYKLISAIYDEARASYPFPFNRIPFIPFLTAM